MVAHYGEDRCRSRQELPDRLPASPSGHAGPAGHHQAAGGVNCGSLLPRPVVALGFDVGARA